MPRGPRLDAPGVLHHVMARGIERRRIFWDDGDRDDFVVRVAARAEEGAWTVYAWSLMPNHFHLLVRTCDESLSRSMRRLLTGYAGYFNRRHRRSGHVFQNRYKSTVVEEEPYFLELVRYLHLNPVRAHVVRDLEGLDGYPYAGHSALVGRVRRGWQETGEVLARYGSLAREARRRYREFVREGWSLKRRRDLMGGGLVRSAGGWEAVREIRRGREAFVSDERVLGSSGYVEHMLKDVEHREALRWRPGARALTFEILLHRVAEGMRVSAMGVASSGRSRGLSRARSMLAYVWTQELGRSGRELARRLGVSPQAVYVSSQRGRSKAGRMRQEIERWCR